MNIFPSKEAIQKLMQQAHAAGFREGFLTAALIAALITVWLLRRKG